ncbi:MAG: hypothetical protein INR63_03250 [Actinomycetospora chiangmaiensis]|nr:hypothetical protein [Actinomycetospora chiangmaiensis]
MTTDPRSIAPPLGGAADPRLPRQPGVRPPAKPPGAKTKLGGLAVVCSKCAKRQGLRPKAIRALLKEAYRDLRPAPAAGSPGAKGRTKGRKLCVVESGCLGPCPKRAVAVATAASLAAGRVLLLDPRAGVEGARAALLPEFGPNGALAGPPHDAGDDPPPSP